MAEVFDTHDCDWLFHERWYRAFERAWSTDPLPPAIAKYLPDVEPNRTLVLCELVHLDLEFRLKRNEAVRVESYLQQYPEFKDSPNTIADWLETEFHHRSDNDGRPNSAEVEQRFPEVVEIFSARCGAAVHEISTARGELEDSLPNTSDQVNTPYQLGRYLLAAELGAGAFGRVHKAIDTGLDRTVAVKVLHGGALSGAEATQRFLHEARSAAQLAHPGIVAVHDAGQQDGIHYLVSEYVDGETLAARLTGDGMKISAAVALVADICDAVHFAHQHGIIHRDLKPANIMLGAGGKPYVMDFGLAKRDTAEGMKTVEGQLVGTPAYMSPEQARGDAHLVDARTDVYSLGVILYQLLTGELPFRGSARMILSHVLESDPQPLRKLDDRVPRDLETITLKCLTKDPAGRYDSAEDLAADLRRWQRGEPITARSISRLERTWRWCRRNPRVATLTGLVLGLMVAITVTSTIATVVIRGQREEALTLASRNAALAESEGRALAEAEVKRQEAEFARQQEFKEKQISEAIAEFMANVLGRPDPAKDGYQVTVVEVLSRAVTDVNEDFAEQPEIRCKLLNSIGDTYIQLGLYADAVGVLEQSRDICEANGDSLNGSYNVVLAHLSSAYRDVGRIEEAVRAGEAARALAEQRLSPQHPFTLNVCNILATAYRESGNIPGAIALREATLDSLVATIGENNRQTMICQADLGGDYIAAGRLKDAASIFEQSLEARRRNLGPAHADTLLSANNLCSVYLQLGRVEDALPILEETLAARRQVLGVDHPFTLSTAANLALAYRRTGRLEMGLSLSKEIVQIQTEKLGKTHRSTLGSMQNLAVMLFNDGQQDEAIAMLEEAWSIYRESLEAHPGLATMGTALAGMYSIAGREADGFRLCAETLALQRQRLGDEHPKTCFTMHNLGVMQLDRGNFGEAINLLTLAFEARRRILGEAHELTLHSMEQLASARAARGEFEKAESLLLECLQLHRNHFPDEWRTFRVMATLGGVYFEQSKYTEAQPLLEEAIAGLTNRPEPAAVRERNNLKQARERLILLYQSTNQQIRPPAISRER